MPYPPKADRNEEIVALRMKDPIKWSYGQLSKKYNVTPQMIYKIWKRETGRLSTGKSEEDLTINP